MRLNENAILSERYKIIRYISSGGFANTYEAIDNHLEKRVAIKELFIDGECNREEKDGTVLIGVVTNEPMFRAQKEKFKKEALRLSGCSHPNIVRVYDVFEENNTIYYAMDFVEGKSLATFNRPMPEAKVRKYLMQILDALEYIHARNILHLDLKPANIMIDGNDNAVLIDFGASKIVDENGDFKSTTSQMAYTPGYAPLEQTSGASKVGSYSDIYALGATLYNLFTGKTPPTIDVVLTNKGVLNINGISAEMQNVITRAMEVSSANRLQNVAEVKVVMNGANEDTCKTRIDSSLPPMVSQKTIAPNSELKLKPNPNPVTPRTGNENVVKPKSGNNKYLLWAIIALLGVIAVLGAVFLIKGTSGSNGENNETQDVAAVVDSTVKDTLPRVDTVVKVVEVPVKPNSKTEEVVTPPAPKAKTIKYTGNVGEYSVTVTLKFPDGDVVGGRVTGSYIYNKAKNRLNLNGYLTDTGVSLTETTPKGNHSANWELYGSNLNSLYGDMFLTFKDEVHSVSLRRIN